jgi:hypothetical protein
MINNIQGGTFKRSLWVLRSAKGRLLHLAKMLHYFNLRFQMKKIIGLVFIVVLIVIAGYLVFREPAPTRIAANVVFKEIGIYASPVNDCLVEVSVVDEGKLKFRVYRQSKGQRYGNSTGPTDPFTADSNWFMCWDSHGKLWTYMPDDVMESCRNWYSNDEVSGSTLPGEGGGWDGIPQAFIDRLPAVVKEKYNTYIKSHEKDGV